jgi:hypothetical protein
MRAGKRNGRLNRQSNASATASRLTPRLRAESAMVDAGLQLRAPAAAMGPKSPYIFCFIYPIVQKQL